MWIKSGVCYIIMFCIVCWYMWNVVLRKATQSSKNLRAKDEFQIETSCEHESWSTIIEKVVQCLNPTYWLCWATRDLILFDLIQLCALPYFLRSRRRYKLFWWVGDWSEFFLRRSRNGRTTRSADIKEEGVWYWLVTLFKVPAEYRVELFGPEAMLFVLVFSHWAKFWTVAFVPCSI